MKLYPTRLTFSDIQREEFSAKPIARYKALVWCVDVMEGENYD